jgi:hypothetical protein
VGNWGLGIHGACCWRDVSDSRDRGSGSGNIPRTTQDPRDTFIEGFPTEILYRDFPMIGSRAGGRVRVWCPRVEQFQRKKIIRENRAPKSNITHASPSLALAAWPESSRARLILQQRVSSARMGAPLGCIIRSRHLRNGPSSPNGLRGRASDACACTWGRRGDEAYRSR